VSTCYTQTQLNLSLTNVLCLDMAISEAGWTWNRPKLLEEIRSARQAVSAAEGTQNIIAANKSLANLLNSLSTDTLPQSITINMNGSQIQLKRSRGAYTTMVPLQQSGLQNQLKQITNLYSRNMEKINLEIQQTLDSLELQKDILSAEQLESLRGVIQSEQQAIQNTNQERVIEVTKEIEEKLVARGFEIRKRMVGKKIVYQAVRR